MDKLFTEGKIGNVTIENRVVFPPVVMFGDYGTEDGFVNEKYLNHFERISKGGSGLIITCAVTVTGESKITPRQLGIYKEEHKDGLKQIADIVHKNGRKIFMQIQHSGLRTCPPFETVSASNWEGTFRKKTINARELTITEIDKIIEDFAVGAKRAKECGYDGVELHGCHGYLISQFMCDYINKREDKYGKRRSTFAVETIKKIKEYCGKDFVCGIRMGMNDPSITESIGFAKDFENAGADFLHVSFGFDMKTPDDLHMPEDTPVSPFVYGGALIKKEVKIPIVLVNDILTPETARYCIENDMGDFIAMCRSTLSDNNFVNLMKEGKPYKHCQNCRICRWYVDDTSCPGMKQEAK